MVINPDQSKTFMIDYFNKIIWSRLFQGPQQNYCFDDGLSGNFEFILEPETVENILNSVEATCNTEYKQEDSKRENINLTKNEINCDSFTTSEKTLSFVCSEFSYTLGEESTNYPEESKGKQIQIWYKGSFRNCIGNNTIILSYIDQTIEIMLIFWKGNDSKVGKLPKK